MALPRNSLAALACAIATAWVMTPARSDDFGTLFHTPKERADLDRLRRGEPPPGQTQGPAQQSGYARPDPVVTGYVRRSDGKSTVFIDQLPYPMGNEKLQERLEPRIIERYVEPAPPPPAPKPQAPAPEKQAPGTAPQSPPRR